MSTRWTIRTNGNRHTYNAHRSGDHIVLYHTLTPTTSSQPTSILVAIGMITEATVIGNITFTDFPATIDDLLRSSTIVAFKPTSFVILTSDRERVVHIALDKARPFSYATMTAGLTLAQPGAAILSIHPTNEFSASIKSTIVYAYPTKYPGHNATVTAYHGNDDVGGTSEITLHVPEDDPSIRTRMIPHTSTMHEALASPTTSWTSIPLSFSQTQNGASIMLGTAMFTTPPSCILLTRTVPKKPDISCLTIYDNRTDGKPQSIADLPNVCCGIGISGQVTTGPRYMCMVFPAFAWLSSTTVDKANDPRFPLVPSPQPGEDITTGNIVLYCKVFSFDPSRQYGSDVTIQDKSSHPQQTEPVGIDTWNKLFRLADIGISDSDPYDCVHVFVSSDGTRVRLLLGNSEQRYIVRVKNTECIMETRPLSNSDGVRLLPMPVQVSKSLYAVALLVQENSFNVVFIDADAPDGKPLTKLSTGLGLDSRDAKRIYQDTRHTVNVSSAGDDVMVVCGPGFNAFGKISTKDISPV